MIIVADQKFKFKKDLKEYVKNLFNTIRQDLYKSYKVEGADFEFLKELIKRHPHYEEIQSKGIEEIIISPNSKNKKHHHMLIKQTNGYTDSVSWNKCITGLKESLKSKQNSALRNEIDEDIREFKTNTPNICNICKESNQYFEIDHMESSDSKEFKDIVEEFKNEHQLPEEFKKYKNTGMSYFKEEDKDLKHKWINFHKKNARLQKLCKPCHNKKTYKN